MLVVGMMFSPLEILGHYSHAIRRQQKEAKCKNLAWFRAYYSLCFFSIHRII